MRMRKFWLENEAGKLIPLNGEEGIFLQKPTGLGLETGESYAAVRDGFYIKTQTSDKQSSPGGELVFMRPMPYDRYTKFIDWVLRAQTLTLIYQPATVAYRRRISLSVINKGEKEKSGVLITLVTFKTLTPWYTEDTERFTVGLVGGGFVASDEDAQEDDSRDDGEDDDDPSGGGGDDSDEKDDGDEAPIPGDDGELPFNPDGGEGLEPETDVDSARDEDLLEDSRVFDFDEDEDEEEAACLWQRLTETDALEGGVIVRAKGHIPSSIHLTYYGAATMPVIYVIGVDTGTEYGRCVLKSSIADGERLEYSTNELDAYIRKVSASGAVTDLLNDADLRYQIFPQLPTTEDCRVMITSESSISGLLVVEVQRYLRAV